MFYYIRYVSKKLFSPKYLLATNVMTGGTLMALGDAINQGRERRTRMLKIRATCGEGIVPVSRNGITQEAVREWDWTRTGTMFTVGLLLGPLNHYYYSYLDKVLPGATGRTVLKKVVLDEIVASPIFTTIFFTGVGLMEGKTLKESFAVLRKKFLTVYMTGLCVYPPAQAINFFFVPSQYRVVYVHSFTLLWNIFLSFMAFSHS